MCFFKCNQEIDLIFTGSSNCIFDDEFLGGLIAIKPILTVTVPHFQKFQYYKPLDPNNFYLVGIDSAKSLTGDFAAIEVYDFINFEQIAEFSARLGSLTKFCEIIKYVIKLIHSEVGDKFLVGIESNSIGTAVIESLDNDTDPAIEYSKYLYHMDEKKKNGIVTSSTSKDRMISIFYDNIHENPQLLHSNSLITQLSAIEKKPNGSISAQGTHKDDLMMASCFCAYMRKYETLAIEPQINVSPTTYAQTKDKFLTKITSFANIKSDNRQDVKSVFATEDVYSFYSGDMDEKDDDKFDMSMFF